MRERYPDQPDAKFVYLPNGTILTPSLGSNRGVTEANASSSTFVGTAYKASSPRYFLDAVDELPAGIRERFETRFIGRVADDEKALLKDRKS